jgi:O-antigen/teichoic acid export membrane protein
MNHKILKNFSTVLNGNFSAQIISLLFYPILVRFYTPEEFGLFGTFTSLVVISSLFCSGQLHLSFVKASDEKEKKNLIWLFLTYSCFTTLFASIVFIILNLKTKTFEMYVLILFPISLLVYIFFEGSKMLSIAEENFKDLAKKISINRLSSNITKLILVFTQGGVYNLIISEILSNGSFVVRKKSLIFLMERPSNIKQLFKKFYTFPVYASFSNFFQLGLMELPILVFSFIYSSKEIGVYSLILRLLLQPLAIVGNSLASVFAKTIRQNHDLKTNQTKTILKIYGFYYLLAIIIFLAIYIIPGEFYLLALGPKWAGFKDYLLPLSILSAAKLSSGLHIHYYINTDQIHKKSIWKAIQLSAVLALIYLYQDLTFINLLWIICSSEAILDFIFVFSTIFMDRSNHTRNGKY